MPQNYYAMLKQIRNMRRDYPNLSIDDKLKLLQMELRLESKSLKVREEHTRKEKRESKDKTAIIRKHNEKNKIQGK